MAETYTDLLLRIYPYENAKSAYPVEAELDDGSRYTGGQLKLDRETLLAQQLNAEAYGLTLFNALFPAGGDILRAYHKATGAAEAQSGGRLRLRLWVDNDAVELHAIPWERLYHLHKGKNVPLGASALTPLSRYTSLEIREPAPIAETPLRLLVAISNPLNLPGGLAPANVDVEIENLRRALSELRKQNKIDVSILPGRTGLSSTIRAKLEAEGYTLLDGATNLFNIAPHLARSHIFHFIGHGAFRRKGERGDGTAALYLEKGDGAWQAVKDEEIVSMFTALGTLPHLVFLVACESAAREAQAISPFVGLGPKLVQAGIPAVVAMQEQVPVEFARVLAGEFYARMAEHGEVDRALNQARLQVFNAQSTDWAIPVLFMRIRKGKLFGADLAEDAPAPGEPPFKGLEFFGENDADKFYGRETLTSKLAGKLRLSRFLPIIIGSSGSGKSSVIRAGLLPALKRGTQLVDGSFPPEGSRSWTTFTLTPGAKPLDALAAALTRDEESTTATTTLIDDLVIDKRALHLRALKILSHRADSQKVLLVVDQFEEVFTLCKDESERRAFIDALLYASAEVQDGPTVVIIIFRADFYAHCAQYDNLREAVATKQEFVGPMSKDELRRAIEEPAKAGGWDIEPGLVDLILKEVGDEPGALPLMQHALLETWKRRRGRALTLRGYNDAGGIRGAIAKTAEAIYNDLPAEQQAVARRIFLRLVELGEGAQDTRRRAQLDELYPRANDKPFVETVLKKLVDNRLIVTTDKTAEVAHEALIREWPTYREWVNKSREGLKIHRDLSGAAREWEELARAPDVLYRGIKFLEALEWAETNPGEMNPAEAEFLNASREATEAQARAKEEQQRRELEAAKRLAEEQQRAAEQAHKAQAAAEKLAEEQTRAAVRQRRLARIIGVVGVVAIFAAIGAVILWVMAQNSEALAQAQAQRALSGQLASRAEALPGTQLDQAVLLNVEAYNLDPGLPRLGNLLTTLEDTPPILFLLRGHAQQITALEFSKDNTWLASGDSGGGVCLWDLSQEPPTCEPLTGHTDRVFDFVFSADERNLWSVSDDAQLMRWDTTASSTTPTSVQLPGGSWALALSPDEQTLAVGTRVGIELRNADSLEWLAGPAPEDELIMSLSFSSDGKLISGGWSGAIEVWDAKTLGVIGEAQPNGRQVSALAFDPFDPAGSYFVSGDWDFQAYRWEAQTREFHDDPPIQLFGRVLRLDFTDPDQMWIVASDNSFTWWDTNADEIDQPLSGYESAIDAAAVSPDGSLAASNAGQVVLVWSLDNSLPPAGEIFPSPAGVPVRSIAVNKDGVIASGQDDGAIQLWDSQNRQALGEPLIGHTATVYDVAFSPDGSRLASASGDSTVRLWEAANGQPIGNPLAGHSGIVYGVTFSPDGTQLASGGSDGVIRLWSGQTGGLVGEIPAAGSVNGLAFSADGKSLFVAINFSWLYVYDVASSQLIGEWPGHTDQIHSVAVSPNGKWVATGSGAQDTTIRLWEAATGISITVLAGHTSAVYDVAFSPDSKLLASASDDGTVRLWDVERRQLIATLPSHILSYAYGVAFAPDGQWVVSGGHDSRSYINLHRLNLQVLREEACNFAGRNMTQAEWKLYLGDMPYHKTCEQWSEGE